VGYFEGIDSERGIAWRVADSLALRRFLRIGLDERTPDHSTISRIRRLIAIDTHREVFAWVLVLLAERGLLKGQRMGIDATTLEANAAMRSIVRRDTGESYEEFLRGLAKASGLETPTREDLARLVSRSPNRSDGRPICGQPKVHLQGIEELVTDKGYHSGTVVQRVKSYEVRSYIPEKKQKGRRDWQGKRAQQQAVYANRHCYETGGMRRCRVRGAAKHSETAVDPRGSIQPESDSATAAGSGHVARTEKIVRARQCRDSCALGCA
jgi:Transposase domain (DUF772)